MHSMCTLSAFYDIMRQKALNVLNTAESGSYHPTQLMFTTNFSVAYLLHLMMPTYWWQMHGQRYIDMPISMYSASG